jgi:hypothetical protein
MGKKVSHFTKPFRQAEVPPLFRGPAGKHDKGVSVIVLSYQRGMGMPADNHVGTLRKGLSDSLIRKLESPGILGFYHLFAGAHESIGQLIFDASGKDGVQYFINRPFGPPVALEAHIIGQEKMAVG